jgi:predicted membrane channel-forming protein YqfA (hemolysin III family)
MKTGISLKNRWRKTLSLLTVFVGFVLLVYMIAVEDEPGALPFLLLIIGVVWFIAGRKQIKKKGQ